jgi:thiol-disulfide isomerase/thioredoxin
MKSHECARPRIRLVAGLALLLVTAPLPAAEAETEADATPAATLLDSARSLLGTEAPASRLETIDGTTLDLAALRGDKAVYLKFWATWCGPCRAQMPHFENVYRTAGAELEVIALNAGFNDTLEDILDYRDELGIHMPIVIDDGMLAGAFNLRITPQHVVIGKDGLIKHIGNLADAELDAVLERERNAPDVDAGASSAASIAAPQLVVGDPLPAATLKAGANSIALQDATAHGTVLVFMIPWCESYLATTRPQQAETCRAVREQIETLKQQQPDLRWLGVASGIWTVAGDLPAYAKDNKVTLPLALDADGRLFRSFGIMTVPTVIVADATGRIVKRIEGHDAVLNDVVSAL